MKVTSVTKKPELESVTVELTPEEAMHLRQLVAVIGGDPNRWPQRKTYDALWASLGKAGVGGDDDVSPLRFCASGSSAYLD